MFTINAFTASVSNALLQAVQKTQRKTPKVMCLTTSLKTLNWTKQWKSHALQDNGVMGWNG